MTKKKLALLCLVPLIAYILSPYYFALTILYDLQAGNRINEQQIDFAKIRDSLQRQVSARLRAKLHTHSSINSEALAGLAMQLVDSLTERLINLYISPEGLSRLIHQHGNINTAVESAPIETNWEDEWHDFDTKTTGTSQKKMLTSSSNPLIQRKKNETKQAYSATISESHWSLHLDQIDYAFYIKLGCFVIRYNNVDMLFQLHNWSWKLVDIQLSSTDTPMSQAEYYHE